MSTPAKSANRFLRRAQSALCGARLTVDEVSSLLLVHKQLYESIKLAGRNAYEQLVAEESAEMQRKIEQRRARRAHLKSLPKEGEDDTQPETV